MEGENGPLCAKNVENVRVIGAGTWASGREGGGNNSENHEKQGELMAETRLKLLLNRPLLHPSLSSGVLFPFHDAQRGVPE